MALGTSCQPEGEGGYLVPQEFCPIKNVCWTGTSTHGQHLNIVAVVSGDLWTRTPVRGLFQLTEHHLVQLDMRLQLQGALSIP